MISCNTGDAQGADQFWTENLKKYSEQVKVIIWTPKNLSPNDKIEGKTEIIRANKTLCRYVDKYLNFLSKNWPQAKYSNVIYASGSLTESGKRGYKGHINKSKYTVVEGGTAYAIRMAINNNKRVYFYNQDNDTWNTWEESTKTWDVIKNVPLITTDFAGIGSTILTENTKAALLKLITESFEN